MSITSYDIAKIANVSQSTVSRCLNNSNLVSEKTRDRIYKIAQEHKFQFNSNARSLSTNRTSTIGLVFPKGLVDFGFDVHFRSWQDALIESLERIELDVIVTFFENRFTKKNNIMKLITAKKIDGLIIVQPELDIETITFLEKTSIPYVFCKYLPSICKTRDVDCIYVDQFKGGYLATNHLIELGHRKIISFSAEIPGGEFELRTEGFKTALNDNNLSFDKQMFFMGNSTFMSGYQIINENKEKFKNVSAIFAQNDLMALGALTALNELNIRIPNDIAIVGFDDIELCTYLKPNLTTIHQPTKDIALLTCKRLVELMNNEQSSSKQKLAIQPKLVIRESSGANIK